MTTLIELKTKYQAEEAEAIAAQLAAEQAKEAHRQQELAELFPKVCEYLSQRTGVDQAEFIRYGRLEGEWYSSGQLNNVLFRLELPEHHSIRIKLYTQDIAKSIKQADWVVDKYNSYGHLGEALLLAAQLYQEQQAKEKQDDERQAQKLKREQAKTIAANLRTAAKQRIFDQVANDPAALLLLKLLVQIQQDRETLNEQIENLEEANTNAEHWHSSALANAERKIKEARQEISDAESRQQSLQSDIYTLEDKLKKAKQSANY